jgi:Fic family protein
VSRVIYAVEEAANTRIAKAKAQAMQQAPLIELSLDHLVGDLARYCTTIETQREVLSAEKDVLKSLEATRDEIVGELARRGHRPPPMPEELPLRAHMKGARDD